MKTYLTISTGEESIDTSILVNSRSIHFGDVYLKYNISITEKDKYESRFQFLAEEISFSDSDIIVFGNPCYNLSDILMLNEELSKFSLRVNGIYIPTKKRITDKKSKAYEEHIKYNRILGTSNEEIEKNFNEFEKTLVEIKNYCKDNSIDIFEV